MGEKLEGRTLFDIEQGGVNGTRASVAILGWGGGPDHAFSQLA
jgi:hypothetical protein